VVVIVKDNKIICSSSCIMMCSTKGSLREQKITHFCSALMPRKVLEWKDKLRATKNLTFVK
jgi:hypothetical protein